MNRYWVFVALNGLDKIRTELSKLGILDYLYYPYDLSVHDEKQFFLRLTEEQKERHRLLATLKDRYLPMAQAKGFRCKPLILFEVMAGKEQELQEKMDALSKNGGRCITILACEKGTAVSSVNSEKSKLLSWEDAKKLVQEKKEVFLNDGGIWCRVIHIEPDGFTEVQLTANTERWESNVIPGVFRFHDSFPELEQNSKEITELYYLSDTLPSDVLKLMEENLNTWTMTRLLQYDFRQMIPWTTIRDQQSEFENGVLESDLLK